MEMIPHYLKDIKIENDEREASPGQASSRLVYFPGASVVWPWIHASRGLEKVCYLSRLKLFASIQGSDLCKRLNNNVKKLYTKTVGVQPL